MYYYKLTVSLKDTPKKVYREFYVSPYVSLYELGLNIVFSFNGAMEHFFYYNEKVKKINFEDCSWLEERYCEDYAYDYKDVTFNYLTKLTTKFNFIYDTGEDYIFEGNVAQHLYPIDDTEHVILIKGKGYGIFEDAHSLLHNFLESDHKFIDVCNEYTSGTEWLPLELKFPLDGTKEDYFKSLTKSQINQLIESIKIGVKEVFNNECEE